MPLNISGDPRVLEVMPHGPQRTAREEALEGLQLLHPAEFSQMRMGNREWVLREVDKSLARRLVGAQYIAEDTLPEKRFLLMAHSWWHPQVSMFAACWGIGCIQDKRNQKQLTVAPYPLPVQIGILVPNLTKPENQRQIPPTSDPDINHSARPNSFIHHVLVSSPNEQWTMSGTAEMFDLYQTQN